MYLKLLRVFLKENFSLKRLLGINLQKNKGKAILIGVAILYGLGTFMFAFGLLFFDMGKILSQIDLIELLLMYAFVYATGLVMLFTLFRSNGYLFHYKDYEILSPLPIHPRVVMFAKLSIMMIMVYFTIILFLLPLTFAYFYYAGFAIFSFLFFLIGILVIPLIPIIVFSLLSLGVARLTSSFRGSKILTTIILFALFLGVMYLSLSLSSNVDNPLLGQQDFIEGIGQIYLPLKWFVQAVHETNVLSLLLLVSVSAVPFGLYFLGIQKLVSKTNQKGLSIKTRKNTKLAKSKTRSVTNSLIQKEFNKYINVPIYALNTGFGPIILLVMGVASLFFKAEIEGFLTQMVGMNIPSELLVMIVVGFCIAMLYTSAISLSLEGKNFWIIKSLPISPVRVMFSKILFNVLLGLPIALISLTLLGITFGIGFLDILIMSVCIAGLSLATSALDSIINLYLPKFEFMNETEVVKQSIGALLAMLGNISIILIGGVVVYFLIDTLSWQVMILMISGIYFLLFGLFVFVIKKNASALFQKMPA